MTQLSETYNIGNPTFKVFVQIPLNVNVSLNVPHLKYISSSLTSWFSASCTAATAHRNHFLLFVPTK